MQLTASKPAVALGVSAIVRVCCVACTEGSRQLILCLVRRILRPDDIRRAIGRRFRLARELCAAEAAKLLERFAQAA
jgi:hypothetical protein